MTYTIFAWMPDTTKFVAKLGNEMGFLDAHSGEFTPSSNPKLVESACSKYHYRRVGPFNVQGAETGELAASLADRKPWP